MRPARGVDDRAGPLALQLRGVPIGGLTPTVLREGNLDWLLTKGLLDAVRVEEELDHLPVTFMQVVEVIEVIEEPVLQRDTGLARLRWRSRRRSRAADRPSPL